MVYFAFWALGIIAIGFWLLHLKLKASAAYKTALKLPGPLPIYPFVGSLFDIMFLNAEQTFVRIRQTALLYKQSFRTWIFGVLHFNVVRCVDLETLLTNTKYITKTDIYKFLHPLMGTGLLTSTGQKWFQRRRILTPAFHFNILQDFLLIFREESHKMVERLKSDEHRHGTELQNLVSKFTLNTICETAMGVKLDNHNEGDSYRRNILKMGQWLLFRAVNVWLHTDFFYKITGLSWILNKYVKRVHNFSWSVIDRRRTAFQSFHAEDKNDEKDDNENIYFGKKKRRAMLDTLFEAEQNEATIDGQGIREEVDTFMFEGYDTTSVGILFTLFMLAHHKKWQKFVYEEITEILGNRNEDELTIADYNEMKLFIRVIKETLRLYPPVAFMGREIREPLVVSGGVELPVGTQVHIHTFDLHRDPDQFPDPEKFDPDRFLPDNASKLHPLAYIPFSAGPRNCIGQKFAMLEIQTLITNILLNFNLSPITKVEDVVFMCDIILRPKYPIKIKFIPNEKLP